MKKESARLFQTLFSGFRRVREWIVLMLRFSVSTFNLMLGILNERVCIQP